jgi:hypothetical protein
MVATARAMQPVGSAIGDQGRAHDVRRLTSASRSRMRHPHCGFRREFGQSGSTLVSLLTPPVGQAPSLS